MGDCGSNLLGYLLGAVIVEGSLKTNALIALIGPLVILAVPFLDTGFVVAKRVKYRRPVYRADRWPLPPPHRRTSASRSGGRCSTCTPGCSRWRAWPSRCASSRTRTTRGTSTSAGRCSWPSCSSSSSAASVYLVYVLEILKFRRLDTHPAAPRAPRHERRRDRRRRRAAPRDRRVRVRAARDRGLPVGLTAAGRAVRTRRPRGRRSRSGRRRAPPGRSARRARAAG